MKITKKIKLSAFFVTLLMLVVPLAPSVSAQTIPSPYLADSQCGSHNTRVITTINFGCVGAHCYPSVQSGYEHYCNTDHSPITDLLFAVIRFLSDGVGLVIIASIIIAGMQYTTSRGEPQQMQHATQRIQSSFIALLVFIFAYALLNYIIPNGLFGQ